jgi:hypothetical protein
MPASGPTAPPLNTFIVRFWQETGTVPPRWCGQVQHVQSGERIAFTDPLALLHFLQRWVRMVETRETRDGSASEGRTSVDAR